MYPRGTWLTRKKNRYPAQSLHALTRATLTPRAVVNPTRATTPKDDLLVLGLSLESQRGAHVTRTFLHERLMQKCKAFPQLSPTDCFCIASEALHPTRLKIKANISEVSNGSRIMLVRIRGEKKEEEREKCQHQHFFHTTRAPHPAWVTPLGFKPLLQGVDRHVFFNLVFNGYGYSWIANQLHSGTTS